MEGLWTPGQVSHVQGAQLEQILQNAKSRLVVVDWFAPWCGPCRRIAPLYQELAARYTSVIFVSVDTEAPLNKGQMLAMKYQIRAFPTFTFHLSNVEKERFSGADPNKLESVVQRLMTVAEDEQLAEALRASMGPDDSAAAQPQPAPAAESKADVLAALDKADAEDPEPEGEKTLKLRAKRTTGAVVEVTVSDKASAQHLRRKLARELETAPESLRIIFRGKIIFDKQTLASYGINEDGLTVHVAVSGKSAAKPSSSTPAPASGGAAPASASAPAAPGAASLRSALQSMERRNDRSKAKDAVQVMLLYVKNIVSHPDDVKYRAIRQGNAKFSSKIASCPGGLECMKALGFEHQDRNGEAYLVLQSGESNEVMQTRQEELKSTIDRLAPASSFPSPAEAGAPSASGFGSAAGGVGNPFAAFGAPGNNFANMFAGMNMGGGGGGAGGFGGAGMPPGVTPEMLQHFQNNPQMQNITSNMMQRLMQDPELMMSVGQAMSSGQDPMTVMMSNPRLMETMMGVMSDPSAQSAIFGAMGQARQQQPFSFPGGLGGAAPSPNAAGSTSGAPGTNGASGGSSTSAASGNAQNSSSSSSNNNNNSNEDDDLDDLDDIYAD